MDASEITETKLLKEVTKNFFLQIPFRCFDEKLMKYIVNNPVTVFNHTILHQLNKKHPLKKSYEVSFLKNVINMLEEKGEEVDESFYHHYINSVKERDNETHYIHFPLENDRFISILQNTNIISGGTTGLSIWQAGRILAQYCSKNKKLFTNKSILELGCGVGLTGLALIFTCHPSHYCFSDAHEKVLDYLIENIKLNLSEKIPIHNSGVNENTDLLFEGSCHSTKISVINFAWENADDSNFCKSFNPDVILAADVVYDSTLFQPLCYALRLFVSRNKNVKIFVSCTVRNESTLKDFFVILHKFNLLENEIKAVTTWNSSYNDECVVKIFSINFNKLQFEQQENVE